MKSFDIFITYVAWENGGKLRPVLVFNIEGGKASLYTITSKYDEKSESIKSKYFKINEWKQAGLSKQSYVDTIKRYTLPVSTVSKVKYVGTLTNNDRKLLFEFLLK